MNMRTRVVFGVSFAFSIFQLSIPVFFPLISLQLRTLHVIFGISTALLVFSFRKNDTAEIKFSFWDLFLIGVVLVSCLNVFFQWEYIFEYPGESTIIDLTLGVLLTITVLEATRRATGWIMPLLVAFLFVFVFLGPVMPGMWKHPGLPLKHVLNTVYYSSEGLFGNITGFSATFISVFIIFGALLMHTGGGKTFMDLALLAAGRFRGGPAKVAIVSSALFGSISGSAAANVSVTGNYTIPLMKKLGYRPNFAGGVEAMASTGGVITPPIMGIAAFIMAEFLGIPYISIIGYAIIPCLLFYIGLFSGVHLEALSLGLIPVPKDELPHWRQILTWSRIVPFSVPIFLLIWLLLKGFVLITAGFYASMAVMVLYIFSDFSLSGMSRRIIQVGRALSQGGQAVARIVPIMVSVSVLVNLLDLTGVAPKLSGLILEIGGEYLITALLVAAIVPLILGTALPATPSYIIAAAILAPALVRLGIDVVAIHMFLFYWAALSAVTPPTCTTVIIAANLAGGDWIKVAFVGMRLGIVAFLVPFFFVIEPSLLARGAFIDIIIHTIFAAGGAFLLASGLFGFMRSKINIFLRLFYTGSGVLLLYPNHSVSIVGILLALSTFLVESFIIKRKMTVI